MRKKGKEEGRGGRGICPGVQMTTFGLRQREDRGGGP